MVNPKWKLIHSFQSPNYGEVRTNQMLPAPLGGWKHTQCHLSLLARQVRVASRAWRPGAQHPFLEENGWAA